MPGECWNCGQWLSGGDLLEGYCWNRESSVRPKDGGYPQNSELVDEGAEP